MSINRVIYGGKMAKKVTMEFIAQKLGITKNTVSLALRNMPGVSQKTRNEILQMAEKYGYKYKNLLIATVVPKQKAFVLCSLIIFGTP